MASCFCVRLGRETVKTLDFRHSNLRFVPEEIVEYDETLEELFLDSNDIRELPRDLFHCLLIKKLGVSDNELVTVPSAVASLINLEELDISKNGIVELPDNIKSCKNLRLVEVSVNPLGKLPEGFTQLMNLTQLYLNDTLLDYLPANFGRMTRLKVLELRENRLKALPKSMSRLSELERLDLGQNSFREIPEVIGSLTKLTEVWIDLNKVNQLPRSFGNLRALVYFDASWNRLEYLPAEMEHLESLTDLHLSKNFLHQLPDNIGKLSNLTTLKADNNQLSSLPNSIGGLVSLEELILSANDLEELPPSVGLLRRLRHLNVDDNMLQSVPPELGSCGSITLLSLRGNYMQVLPDEIGRMSKLAVVNLSNNRLQCLPYSFTKLKNLQALWLSENQSKPLIPLQPEVVDQMGTRVLTCFMFPQQPQDYDEDGCLSDGESFHPSVWEQERARRTKIVFDVAESELEPHQSTARATTPYPKETIRPRFRMGAVPATPNGHLPGRRPNLADKVQSPQMELLPNKPAMDGRGNRRVRGRRELELDGIRIREAKVTRPRSPGSTIDSLHLFQADKEKRAKDKARIRRSSAESEAEASPRSKGFFRKSKPDRAAHSDTEAVDPDWTPRTSSMRRSLTVEDAIGQERSPLLTAALQTRPQGNHHGRKSEQQNDRSSWQNGDVRNHHHQRSNGRMGTLERDESDYGTLEGRRASSGENVVEGNRRRGKLDMHYQKENQRRRSMDPGVNAAGGRRGESPAPTGRGQRTSHHRRSGYGTDPELEELYHNSLEKQTPRQQEAVYIPPLQKSGYTSDTGSRVSTRTGGSGVKQTRPEYSSNNKLDQYPHSGYGTDSEIMAFNGPFDYSSPSEDQRRSSGRTQRTREKQNHTPKQSHAPKQNHTPKQNHVQKSQEHRVTFKEEWVDGRGFVREAVPVQVPDREDEHLEWAIPNFESNKGADLVDGFDRKELVEEPRAGHRGRRSDHAGDLGRLAVTNAHLERSDGHLKDEPERVDTSSELDSHQALQWDISEILGSSSRTVGQSSTDTHSLSPQKSRIAGMDHMDDGSSGKREAEGGKKVKSSTPEDGRQGEKNYAAKSKNGPSSARNIGMDMAALTNQGHRTEDTPSSAVLKDQHVPVPHLVKRDPNSPLPPSPVHQAHRDSPVSTAVHKPDRNASPMPQYYPQRHKSDSPLPFGPNRNSPKDVAPLTKTQLRNHTNALRVTEGRTSGSQGRSPGDQRQAYGQVQKRGAIPSYEEAVLRRRDSLGNQQSSSMNSLAGHRTKQAVQPSPLASSSNNLDNRDREEHIATQSKLAIERLHDEKDDYETVDDWYEESGVSDHELQGQRHDRKSQHDLGPVRPGESTGKVPNGKIVMSPQDQYGMHQESNKEEGQFSSRPARQRPGQDHGDEPTRQFGHEEGNSDYHRRQEANMHRGVPRGKSPNPIYAAQRTPTAPQGGQIPPYRGGQPQGQRGGTSTDRPPVRAESKPTSHSYTDREKVEDRPSDDDRGVSNELFIKNKARGSQQHLDQPDAMYGSQRDINHNNRPQEEVYRGPRVSGYRAHNPPQYYQKQPSQTPPTQGEQSASRGSVGTPGSRQHPSEINEENWRHHLMNRLAKKQIGHEDSQQTPVSIRRVGDQTKTTVQERRLHVLRARMQNEMKSGDDSLEDVFHATSLPSRSPAGPQPQAAPHTAHPKNQPQQPRHHQPAYQPPSQDSRGLNGSPVRGHPPSQRYPTHDTQHPPQYPNPAANKPRQFPTPDTKYQQYPTPDTSNPRQYSTPDTKSQHYRTDDTKSHQYSTPSTNNVRQHPTPDTKSHNLPTPDTNPPHYPTPDTNPPHYPTPDTNKPQQYHTPHTNNPPQYSTADADNKPGRFPTADTRNSPQMAVQGGRDPPRHAPPPGYHHHHHHLQRDWSPPAYGKPGQTQDQADSDEFRRGTPPGSSGSSTAGGNGRSFAPSPSLQRRLPPYQSPLHQSHSPLPGRRADPDGIGGPKMIPLVIYKNPGLGFSITGGKNSPGNPFHPEDMGIFVTKVQPDGPADHRLLPGDKILEVNDQDFVDIDHEEAVQVLKTSNPVSLLISRET